MILFSPRLAVFAQENFTSDYSQTEYTEEDGFESGEANCIVQSSSGYIWIGTDSGLYRNDSDRVNAGRKDFRTWRDQWCG